MPIFFCFFINIYEYNMLINRRPLVESELISGFNVKYFGVEFALIFIAEWHDYLFALLFY